ncbi:Zn-ribbon domain-containing OB-fold protein [Pseudolysinimonas kribbensis]|uniref:Zn-ribbon domain-containing OB-fold protein n=1 Tax=Pseudolysinimonas kribbensis TaxID=433641 RepID=UPI003D672C0A
MGERIGISPAAVYAEGLVGGRLRYQRCTRCGHAVFFPRVVCPHCGDARLEWEDSAGSGWSTRRRPPAVVPVTTTSP